MQNVENVKEYFFFFNAKRDEQVKHRIFRAVKLICRILYVGLYLTKPTEHKMPRVNPNEVLMLVHQL